MLRANTPSEKLKFYQRFLLSSNFSAWLQERLAIVGNESRKAYLRRLTEANLEEWMEGRGKVELEELEGRLMTEAVSVKPSAARGWKWESLG